MSNFPGAIDTNTELPSDIGDDTPSTAPNHATLHNTVSEAIIALEEKVGTGASTPAVTGQALVSQGSGGSSYQTLPVIGGGTGATSQANARINLGLVVGTDVEAHSTDLDIIAGLTPSNDDVLQRKSSAWTNRSMSQLAADLKVEIGKLLFPVGSYYMNETDSTNPATLLGFGTWTAVTGRIPVGKAASGTFSTAGATGGSETNTHNHYQTNSFDGGGAYMTVSGQSPRSRVITVNRLNWGGSIATTSAREDSTYDETIAILPPYVVVYMWKRTA